MAGSFRPVLITDTRDQYFRLTSLGLNAFADALKAGSFSVFVGTGISFNYSRGLMGTGGYQDESYYGDPQPSEYFHRLYYAGNVSAGFRLNQKNRRVAYNFSPLNYHFGSRHFFIGVLKFDVDIKLNAKEFPIVTGVKP